MNAQSTIELRSGSKMPVMGLGTWQLTGDDAVSSAAYALEIGYRMIDTSSDYRNHEQIGRAIRDSLIPRQDIYLVTKVEEDDNSYEAVKEYLGQLGMNYADLILIHRPPSRDVGTDLWKGLVQAKQEGLTRDIGISNYSIDQIEELIKSTGVTPVVNQIEWSPFGFSKEMLRYCRSKDIIIQAYSPLTRQGRLDEGPIVELAEKYGKTPAQIMIRWDLQHKVVPIVKATSREHLEENIDVFDFSIGNDDIARLDDLNEHYSSLGRKPLYV